MIERPDLAADPGLATMIGRLTAPQRSSRHQGVDAGAHTVAEVVERGALFRLPATEVGNGETLPAMEHPWSGACSVPAPHGGFLQPAPLQLHV